MIGAPPKLDTRKGILSLGPVAYWPMNDVGGQATEIVRGLHLTPTAGTFTYRQASPVGMSGIKFDGTAAYLSAPVSTILHPADTFSVVLWLKRASIGTDQNIWLSTTNDVRLYIESGNVLVMRKYGVANVVFGTTTLADTTSWHHLAFVKNGATNANAYIDAVDVGGFVGDQTMVASTTTVKVGSDPASQYLDGTMAHLALFNKALSASAVRFLYHLGLGN